MRRANKGEFAILIMDGRKAATRRVATCSGTTARGDLGQIGMDSSKKAPHAELSRYNSGPLRARTKDSLQEVHSLIYTKYSSLRALIKSKSQKLRRRGRCIEDKVAIRGRAEHQSHLRTSIWLRLPQAHLVKMVNTKDSKSVPFKR